MVKYNKNNKHERYQTLKNDNEEVNTMLNKNIIAKVLLFIAFVSCCTLTILMACEFDTNGLAAEYIEKTDAFNRYIWRSDVSSTSRFTGIKYIRTIDNRTVNTPVEYTWTQKYGKGFEFNVSASGGVEGYKKVISMSVSASIGYNEYEEVSESVRFTVQPGGHVRYQQETQCTSTIGSLFCMYQKWYLFKGWQDYSCRADYHDTILGQNLGNTVFVLIDLN